MTYNWTPYAVGGATRPDSFSGMTPEMQRGLYDMLRAADQEVGSGLQVYSGYRSPELQARLYQNALKKYGSEAKARKWVAPPGRSKHNYGQAADLKWNGTRIDQLPEDHPVRQWLPKNAARFGLALPMSWEPWQVEAAGARGAAPATPQMPSAPQVPAAPPMPQAPRGGLLGAIGVPSTPMAPTPQMPDPGPQSPQLPAGINLAFPQPASPLEQLAAMVANNEALNQPPPIQPAPMLQAPMYAPERRDTVSPYLALFQNLMGGQSA